MLLEIFQRVGKRYTNQVEPSTYFVTVRLDRFLFNAFIVHFQSSLGDMRPTLIVNGYNPIMLESLRGLGI